MKLAALAAVLAGSIALPPAAFSSDLDEAVTQPEKKLRQYAAFFTAPQMKCEQWADSVTPLGYEKPKDLIEGKELFAVLAKVWDDTLAAGENPKARAFRELTRLFTSDIEASLRFRERQGRPDGETTEQLHARRLKLCRDTQELGARLE